MEFSTEKQTFLYSPYPFILVCEAHACFVFLVFTIYVIFECVNMSGFYFIHQIIQKT